MIFARVAVPVPARAGALFTYAVPERMTVDPGCLVVVPFASRILPAVVVEITPEVPAHPIKDLLGLVGGAPAISTERVRLAQWIASYYRASLFDALSLFLPSGWQRAVVEDSGGDASAASWVFRWPVPPVFEDSLVVPTPESASRRASARVGVSAWSRAVALLEERGAMRVSDLAAEIGCTLAAVRGMVTRGMLMEAKDLTPQHSFRRGNGETQLPPIILNPAQQSVFSEVDDALQRRSPEVFLLHGVTGSGKTQVYLRLIESLVRGGRRAIVLVSEIAQTPEALERYQKRFPGKVAVLHSVMPDAHRCRLWREIYQGRFDVVIGPRSALFAPVPDLGLIVLDEEHEPAYKQEESPRYHARDVAIQLGRRVGAPVVLGSATPDVVSYHLAERGVYRLRVLPDRYSGPTARGHSSGKLPVVDVVDLREELKAGNTGIFSRSLRAGLESVLGAGEQAILFLNRRGSATCVLCRDCGHVLKCRRCEVPLVYHKELGELVCHQCNRQAPPPPKCPRCKKSRIGFFGVGTQRVEEEVRKQFPGVRVLRWDHDAVGRRDAHLQIHRQFESHQADVLVGTQMVAKALDFPGVTLVGVVLADVTLHLPDFRAAERTFQLLAQVAGRAGRGEAEGRVVIQTYSPAHYSVLAAARHDYLAFYGMELAFRRYHGYPPFRRLARLLFTGSGEARARYEAIQMRKRLQARVDELGIGDVDLLGPAPAFHSRIRGRYRWQIVLAGEGLARLLEGMDLPLGWAVDVDPMSLI